VSSSGRSGWSSLTGLRRSDHEGLKMSWMSAGVEPGRVLVGSVLRALRLLELFECGRPEMSLAELVRRSGYSKSTTYRLLVTLEHAEWLERSPSGAHSGQGCASPTCTSADRSRSIWELLRVRCWRSTRTSCCRLCWRKGLSRKTGRSLVDPADLRADLAETRRRGYSISDQDVTHGIWAIGAPIFGADGHAVAGLSVGGLRQRIIPPHPAHVACLLQASQEISTRLGYRQP
jgi:IclR helix-turn-helix domain/Bacterial transcriptional regulator